MTRSRDDVVEGGLGRTTLATGGLEFSALTAGAGDEVVVCVHGFPDTPRTFRELLPALGGAGFRGVAPTLRGYEPWSQPAVPDYDVSSLAGDVIGWIDALGARRAHLVGHDWGAVLGYAAAALAPDRVASLTALAIPPLGRLPEALLGDPRHLRPLWYMALFQLRGVAEQLVARRDLAFIDALWRRWSPGWELPEAERRLLHEALARPGVLEAALGYYRALFSLWRPAARRTLALLRQEIVVPTLVLYGDQDGCMPPGLFPAAAARAPFSAGLDVEAIDGAGHFLHLERPDRVNARILAWLERWRTTRA